MAQCKQTPVEFIKNAFTPQVAVMCSPLAEQVCKKNNLSFIELLQPFLILNGDVHYKDPSGTTVTIHNLKITLSDVNFRPPQPTLARKLLNASVSEFTEPRLQTININEYTLNIPISAPWFEAWRDTFLKVQFPSDHEFTKHFLACILVVSSSESNPVETLVQLAQNLNQLQNNSSNKLPKWFNSNVLRYCVVIHDNTEGNLSVATQSVETIKESYGVSNCFLLRMNSRPPGQTKDQLPDPWSQFLSNHIDVDDAKMSDSFPNGSQASTDYDNDVNVPVSLNFHPLSPDIEEQPVKYSNIVKSVVEKSSVLHGACLTTDDVEQIKLLIHEFCTRALLPYIEKQIQQITENVSNKKGVSRSIFSATKRWFTPNKPGTNMQGVLSLIYSPDSLELQMRKLGDLYFMFGHYNLAFQAYHSAKRDFNADQAWLYYAGALEMAALAAFMSNESTRKTFDYMEEGITTYLNTCKVAQFATRATLLSSECLKGRNFYGEAAHQLIRMTSEESDLRSAVLLEQAAYCFLQNTKPTMVRKYAFHMVLAGHRYSKAAQRKHSLRSYKQAFQIYQNRSWNLAEDHIHFTIGRQASHLLQYKEAIESFEKLLTGESGQTPLQQAAFLKEYISIHSLMEESFELTQILPLPVLLNENIKILVEPTPPLKTPGKIPAVGVNFSNYNDAESQTKWNRLEELLVQEAEGSPPMIFKPIVTLYTIENLAYSNPIAVINEPIQVSVSLHNSLHISLNLKDIYLLWTYKNAKTVLCNDVFIKNIETYVKTHIIKSAVIQPNCSQELTLSVTPLVVGKLQLKGIFYKLTNVGAPEEVVMTSGKQMFDVKVLKSKNVDVKDRKFEITIVPAAPCMHVTFSELPSELFCNEIRKVSVDLRNVGTIPLHNVYMATSTPHLISNYEFGAKSTDSINAEPMKSIFSIPLPNNKLESGQCCNLNLWVKAPEFKGPTVIDLLIYYENYLEKSTPKYRLVKHNWQLSVLESISVDVTFQSSTNPKLSEHSALAVKVTNLNNVHHAVLTKITLLKAAFLSRHWMLCDDFISPNNLKLKSQDIGHVVFKAKRKQLSDSGDYSEVLLSGKKTLPDINTEVYLDFAKRFKFYNAQDEYVNVNENMEAILILQWRASVIEENKKREINGQWHIPVCKLNIDKNEFLVPDVQPNLFDMNSSDTTNKIENGVTADMTLTYNLLHPPKVLHDFKRNKICVVPVKLILYSRNDTDVLIVNVNTLGTSSTSSLPSYRPNICYAFSSRHFRWIGASSTVHRINPLSSKCVKLSVAVMGPGTYDIGARIEVSCKKIDQPDDAVLQTCRVQSAVLVINCDS